MEPARPLATVTGIGRGPLPSPLARQPPAPPSHPLPHAAPHRPLWRHRAGRALRERRHAAGLRLRDVAERAGLSAQYLSEIERGRKEASSEVLDAACRALGMDLLDLVRAVGHGLADTRPAGATGSDGLASAARRQDPPAGIAPPNRVMCLAA